MDGGPTLLFSLLQLTDSAFPTGSFSHSLGLETFVHISAVKSFKAKLTEMDKMLEACSTNHIAKRASTRQGRTFFEVCKLLYAASNESVFTTLSDLPFCHYPVVYGAVLAGLGLDLEVTLSSFIFGVSRTLVSTAVRLDVLVQWRGKKVQHILHQKMNQRKWMKQALSFPVMDILQNSHDKLFSKLFYS
ncbi:uncharacterized protein LOC131931965 [Physella acuta]|uniref:uncharacterized protein LOC131931965 n=1 Tax=Physella acuta TaxID=109671 RepID=UPI0027DE8125|nr:uncharacterized protein LOC131931965 [Physella acuta]